MTTNVPEGYNTINPFVITKDAPKFLVFLEEVFGARGVKEAYTMDTDGLVLHAESRLGNSTIMVAERKEGWPFIPSLLQVYVADVEKTLQRARDWGAEIVTKPTAFYGSVFSRMLDPWGNLWWVYQHEEDATWQEIPNEGHDTTWDTGSNELNYIHETLLQAMQRLGQQQRLQP